MQHSNSSSAGEVNTAVKRRRIWLGLPVVSAQEGTLEDVLKVLPHFGRQPFAMASVNGNEIGVNRFLDMVYCVALRQGQESIPVGVVSKNYRLVDHHQVLRTIQDALLANNVKMENVHVTGEWTVHGERARFSILLPAEERFMMPLIGQDDQMRFRIEIFNSVEGSCRLTAVAGWLRFVCSNGLIVGTALMQLGQQHRQPLQVEELGRLLREVLHSTENDKSTFRQWLSDPIVANVFVHWADRDVREQWGPKAAVRVLGIVRDGHDVEPVGDMKNRRPSEIQTKALGRVAGVDAPVDNIFGVSQVLSWIAGQRSELIEDLEWRSQVPDLVGKLIQQTKQGQQSMFES